MGINEILFLILIAIISVPILGFIIILKRYNNLKKENANLKYIILKSRTKTNSKDTKEQKFYEYQSIIDKMKSRFGDNN